MFVASLLSNTRYSSLSRRGQVRILSAVGKPRLAAAQVRWLRGATLSEQPTDLGSSGGSPPSHPPGNFNAAAEDDGKRGPVHKTVSFLVDQGKEYVVLATLIGAGVGVLNVFTSVQLLAKDVAVTKEVGIKLEGKIDQLDESKLSTSTFAALMEKWDARMEARDARMEGKIDKLEESKLSTSTFAALMEKWDARMEARDARMEMRDARTKLPAVFLVGVTVTGVIWYCSKAGQGGDQG